MTSDTRLSLLPQRLMRSSKTFLNGLKFIACVWTMCSSSRLIASSTLRTTKVIVFLYGCTSNSRPRHCSSMRFSADSIWYSLPAESPTLLITSR